MIPIIKMRWPSYLYNGNVYTGKTTSLYWNGTQGLFAINTLFHQYEESHWEREMSVLVSSSLHNGNSHPQWEFPTDATRYLCINVLIQDCGISSANALEIPQSCAKTSIYQIWLKIMPRQSHQWKSSSLQLLRVHLPWLSQAHPPRLPWEHQPRPRGEYPL